MPTFMSARPGETVGVLMFAMFVADVQEARSRRRRGRQSRSPRSRSRRAGGCGAVSRACGELSVHMVARARAAGQQGAWT